MRVIDAAALPEPIIDACRELASEPSAFAADIAFIRILQGRLDDIDAVFDALPAEVRESKRVRVGRAGARALAAMLRGDDVQARRHIESAVAEERAGTRKRNVFPASTAFALSLLSLVRDDSPSSRALLAPLLRASAHQKVQPLVMHYVTRAAEARKGAHIDAMTFPYPVFGMMLQGLECCWLGQLGQYTDQAPYQALVGYMGPRTGQRLRVGGGGVSDGHGPARPAEGGRASPVRGGVPRRSRRDTRAARHPFVGLPAGADGAVGVSPEGAGGAGARGPQQAGRGEQARSDHPPAPAGVGAARRHRRGRGQAARAA